MNVLHWLSDTYRRRSRRERAVVVGGVLVSVFALGAVYVVAPLIRHWVEREEEIVLKAEQLARLESLVERREEVQAALRELHRQRDATRGVLLQGRTAAVAASELLDLVNRYAMESRIVLEQVDVARQVEVADSLVPIPARITARGDIYGLVDFFFYLQHGEKLLVVDELRLNGERSTRAADQLMSWTLTVHGYYTSPGRKA